MAYRASRNFEASILDFITTKLTAGGWSGINVEKAMSRVYDIDLPIICVRVSDTNHTFAELGDSSTIREPLVLIDIFGSDDGNRLDLKDFLIAELKGGIPYYTYIITNNVANKTLAGRIIVTEISDTPIDFDTPKSNLTKHDRWRHLLSLRTTLNEIEA